MQRTIAIVGLGAAARNIHLPAYRKLPSLRVIGGADRAVSKSAFPFPVFDSLEELLAQTKPDILTVATPTDFHFGLAKTALSAGCHVFCEKPFMTTLAEADQIIDLARHVGRRIVVNNEFRFMNAHIAAQKMIGRPEFGDLLFVAMHQTFFVSEETEAGWRGRDPRRTCKEFGTHVLDLCRFFFGEDPRSVSARMPKLDVPDGPDYLNLIQLEFSRDRVAHIVLDRLSRGPHRYLDIQLDGSAGCIETSLGGKLALSLGVRPKTRRPFAELDVTLGGRARLYHGETFRPIGSDPLDLFASATARLMGEFLEALNTGATPPCDASDNRRTLALMLAAYDSHEQRRSIEMRY